MALETLKTDPSKGKNPGLPGRRFRAFMAAVAVSQLGEATAHAGVDLATREEPPARTPLVTTDSTAGDDRTPLSSSAYLAAVDRKEPHIVYAEGGRSVMVKLPGPGPVNCGKRGNIQGFSSASRRKLLTLVNSLDQRKCAPGDFAFVTLTYPADFPTARASKRDLAAFIKRFQRDQGRRWMIWKLEPQKRGAPHYHLLIRMGAGFDQASLCNFVAQAWHDLAGGGDANHLRWHLGALRNRPCVEVVRDWQGVANYATKYLAKSYTGEEEWWQPGRFWGVRNSDLAAITMVAMNVTERQAYSIRRVLIRYYEKQNSGWVYTPGKPLHDGSGHIMPKIRRASEPWGDIGTKTRIGDIVNRSLDETGVQWRHQRRRWRSGRGGFACFVSSADFARVVQWAKRE